MHQKPVSHINKLFADAVFTVYRSKRYGIKKCNLTYDPDYLNDLRELQQRAKETAACERQFGCGLVQIEEKIQTL